MKGSLGAPGIDVRALYKQSGHFTFDPGYTSTCSTESQITYIDGGEGQLLYRGYDVEKLAEESTSLEVAYLLIHGELPNAAEYKEFEATITNHTMLHDQIESFFQGYRRDSHPMSMLCGTVGALSGFYHDDQHTTEDEARNLAMHRHQLYVLPDHQVQTRMPVLRRAQPVFGARLMVAQMRLPSTCSKKLELWTVFPNLLRGQKTSLIHSA